MLFLLLFRSQFLLLSFLSMLTIAISANTTVINYNTDSNGNTNHNVNRKKQFLLQLQLKEFWKYFLFPNLCSSKLVN